jgi:hypothetical protein
MLDFYLCEVTSHSERSAHSSCAWWSQAAFRDAWTAPTSRPMPVNGRRRDVGPASFDFNGNHTSPCDFGSTTATCHWRNRRSPELRMPARTPSAVARTRSLGRSRTRRESRQQSTPSAVARPASDGSKGFVCVRRRMGPVLAHRAHSKRLCQSPCATGGSGSRGSCTVGAVASSEPAARSSRRRARRAR